MPDDNQRFATRLNSFASKPEPFWPKGQGKPTPLQMAERAATVVGLTDVDLNYPDHLGSEPRATGAAIRDLGLAVNGLAMRYYSNPAFKIGAFTNPDPVVRREAIDLTKRGHRCRTRGRQHPVDASGSARTASTTRSRRITRASGRTRSTASARWRCMIPACIDQHRIQAERAALVQRCCPDCATTLLAAEGNRSSQYSASRSTSRTCSTPTSSRRSRPR